MNWGTSRSNKPSPASTQFSSPTSTQYSSPTHQNATPQARAAPTTPINQARSPCSESSTKSDYSRSHFDENQANQKAKASACVGGGAGVGGGDIFADILGQQGYNFASKANAGPRSINDMRKVDLVKEMDPDKLRIFQWVYSFSHSQ